MTASTDPVAMLTREREIAASATHRFVLPLAPSLERRRLQVYIALLSGDTLAIIVAFVAVSLFMSNAVDVPALGRRLLLFVPLYWIFAIFLRVYSVESLVEPRRAQLRVTQALVATIIALFFVFFLAQSPFQIRRTWMLLNLAGSAALMISLRSISHGIIARHCGPTAQNVLIIDDGGGIVRIPGAWTVQTREHNLRPDISDPHMLDRLGLFMTNMDRVLVTCPYDRRAAWAMVFKGSNICGEIVDQDVLTLGVVGARRASAFGTLVVSLGPLSLLGRAIKRAMDLTLASLAIVALFPLLITIAVLIRLEDGGPVLFCQQRQGRNNRLFWIYKFRSMRELQHDPLGVRSATRDDDRITRIGRFIRRSSIDELPQLFNVLRGEMSIVGPRPHAIGSLAGNKQFWEVDPRYLLRHSLKPGLTGLAQVRGLRGATDSETDLVHRLQADLEYLDGWTVMRDIRIIAATLTVVVHERAF